MKLPLLFRDSEGNPSPQWLKDYSFAIMAPFIALACVFLVDPTERTRISWLLFFLPIALSAWYGGYKPAVLTTLISAVIINYFFAYPHYSFFLMQPATMLQTILFLIEGVCIGFLIDIGKRQKKLIDYRRREKELKEKIIQLESENTAAKKEIRSRDEFLSIASHELKTPLTSMLLQTQNALHNIRNVSLAHFSIESLLKMLESVENQTKRLSKMINDLLNISLITTGNLQLVYEKVDLNAVVSEVLEEFSARIEREKYELIFNEPEPIIGQWDKIRIGQATSNLISNAIKYGNHQPIEVKIQKHNDSALIIVMDHGIGISKEQQKKIFGLFERAVSPDEYKGLGVGLYITNQIVKAHDGMLMVSSKLGKGATFTIKLPIKNKTDNSQGAPSAATSEAH